MTELYRHMKHSPAWLVCALAGASLLASGCGKPESPTEEGRADHSSGSQAVSGSTAHSHDSPEETCFICDPSKRDKGRLWCKGHGRYEDRCWLCHPELEDKDRLFCAEHALYEDECFLCHPELRSGDESVRSKPSTEAGGENGAAALFCN